MKRTITQVILNPLAEKILAGKIEKGKKLFLDLGEKDALVIETK